MIKDAAAVDGNGSPTDISKGSDAARPHWCLPGPSARSQDCHGRHVTLSGIQGRKGQISVKDLLRL